jgi:hypothetical protein
LQLLSPQKAHWAAQVVAQILLAPYAVLVRIEAGH